MAWSAEQLDRIGDSSELHITSVRRDGSLRRWTPIWVVRVGDNIYIRSAYGDQGAWYRHVTATNTARIRAAGVEADVILHSADDSATNADVDAAYKAKYHDQPDALKPMITPPATETTMRIEPGQSKA